MEVKSLFLDNLILLIFICDILTLDLNLSCFWFSFSLKSWNWLGFTFIGFNPILSGWVLIKIRGRVSLLLNSLVEQSIE